MWVRGKRTRHVEQGVESMNISIRGTYFAAEGPFRVGEKIQVRLTMPEAVVSGQTTEWCLTGRVEHVNPLGTCGKAGVGVHFLCYTTGIQPTEAMQNAARSAGDLVQEFIDK
jgi:hypothetical protein